MKRRVAIKKRLIAQEGRVAARLQLETVVGLRRSLAFTGHLGYFRVRIETIEGSFANDSMLEPCSLALP